MEISRKKYRKMLFIFISIHLLSGIAGLSFSFFFGIVVGIIVFSITLFAGSFIIYLYLKRRNEN